jgi:hypothetical protein
MIMRLLPVLLLTAACSRELDPPGPRLVRPLARNLVTASFGVASRDVAAGSYTTPWTDSSKLGDTTFYSRGRVVTTLAILTDSLWAVRPPLVLGLPYGPSGLPPDSLCTLGYTGTTIPVFVATVLQDLQRMHDCHARTFAQIRLVKLKDSTGKLSVRSARAELDTWPWTGLCSRVQDSTIVAFYIGDDVEAAQWGPARLATRLAQWDTIAGVVRSRCPDAPVVLRAHPTQLEARPNWQWVTTAWTQYSARRGPPEQFLAMQVASARRQHLGLVAGVNLLNGGCGPAALGKCLPDVPGTALPGTQPGMYQVSAAELVYYKTVAMTDPYICASVDWSWGPNFQSNFHERADIRSAAKALGVMARKRAVSDCIQR